jgi:repressor LexA
LYNTSPNALLGLPTDTETRIPSKQVEVPILGEIPAGRFALSDAVVEGTRWVDEHLVAGEAHFLLRVKGNCMWPRFHDGDLALVRVQDEVEQGELAVVRVDDEGATLKRYRREGGMVALSAENPSALADPTRNPIMVAAHRVAVIGKVVGGMWE